MARTIAKPMVLRTTATITGTATHLVIQLHLLEQAGLLHRQEWDLLATDPLHHLRVMAAVTLVVLHQLPRDIRSLLANMVAIMHALIMALQAMIIDVEAAVMGAILIEAQVHIEEAMMGIMDDVEVEGETKWLIFTTGTEC